MSGILKFARLDFITFKNSVGLEKIIILLLVLAAIYFFAGFIFVAGMLPLLLSTLTTQNFAAGDDGLDLFYTSLQLKRKSVVFGRYAFIGTINLIVLLLLFILAFLEDSYLEPMLFLVQISSIIFLTTLIDFINAPILFKLGFKKGRIVVQSLPIVLMLGTFVYLHFSGIGMNINPDDLMNYIQVPELNPLIMLGVWITLLAISVLLSLKFYLKREL